MAPIVPTHCEQHARLRGMSAFVSIFAIFFALGSAWAIVPPKAALGACAMTTTQHAGGTVYANGVIAPASIACANQTVTFHAVPAQGYYVQTFNVSNANGGTTINGGGASADGTVSPMYLSGTVDAWFQMCPWVLTVGAVTHGTVTPGNGTIFCSAPMGVNVTIQADPGYQIQAYTLNGAGYAPAAGTTNVSLNVSAAQNATLFVNFTPLMRTITVTQGSNGFISPGTTSVVNGGSQTMTATPMAGYQITSVTVDGAVVQGPVPAPGGYSYAFTNVTANHTMTAAFSLITYPITVIQNGGGTTSPGTTSVVSGGSQTFTFTPDPGYNNRAVVVDGVITYGVGSYTFNNVTAPHTVNADYYFYVPPTYTIGVTQGANGTISPGNTTVASGGSQTFSITPAAGYQVQSVTVDGVNQGAVTSYTFSNVTTAHGITAAYVLVPITYPITVTQAVNGTISPGTTSVASGGSQAYLITPAPGYQVQSVIMDGVDRGASEAYMISNVTAPHTITAAFSAIPVTGGGNLAGWLWNDSIGWISVSSTNPNACASPPCGTYGANVDLVTSEIDGFGWNDAVGWICFGRSCSAAACSGGTPPIGAPPTIAQIQPISGMTPVVGWAKVCAEPANRGWISLSCVNDGTCSSAAYGVRYDPTLKRFGDAVPPPFTSFAWNKNTDGSGLGWIEFSRMILVTGPENCTDVGLVDEDLNGKANCVDTAACGALPACQENTEAKCSNGQDDDGNGSVDCADTSCKDTAYCAESKTNRDTCSNVIDDNHNGAIDCADAGCVGAAGCDLTGEPACLGGGLDPVHADTCCSNLGDDDGNGQIDCADTNCISQAPTCNKAWLQFKFGNVYSGQGITGTAPTGNTPNATYCLTSQGSISGFTSQSGCTEQGSESLALPSGAQSFQSKLGNIDVAGILLGKYGKVQNTWVNLPVDLDGQVYVVNHDLTIHDVLLFQNALLADHKGSGLLIVNGGNLTINGNLDYASPAGVTVVRNLASFGVLVLKNGDPSKGNILIDGGVTKMAGAYFAEGTVSTCASGDCKNFLDVFGLMAARQFDFGRTKGSTTRGAETITFDGRAVINPPPGMQDISKSLPIVKESF